LIKANDKEFAGIWSISKDLENQIPPLWMAYILVENLDSRESHEKWGIHSKTCDQAGDMGLASL